MRYKLVCVAGTFAGLHAGHEAVLEAAFGAGEKVIIGLTSDLFIKRHKNIKYQISNIKYTNKISNRIKQAEAASYKERERVLKCWLKNKGLEGRVTIVAIEDPWEPAASLSEAEALIVTAQNKARGEEINRRRESRDLAPLALIEVPLVVAEDGQPISSTRVRNGEIDNNGKLIMPEALRNTLAQPLDKVLVGKAIGRSLKQNKNKIMVTVGDVATKTLLEAGVIPSLIIIDNKVGRQPYTGLDPWRKTLLLDSIKVVSGPGYIGQEALSAIKEWANQCLVIPAPEPACAGRPGSQGKLKGMPDQVRHDKQKHKPYVIEVEGEEDLLALPAVVEAPLGAVVYYGQPRIADVRGKPPIPTWACGPKMQGLVEVEVSEKKKGEAVVLLEQFV